MSKPRRITVAQRRRRRRGLTIAAILVLLLAGAALDPSIVPPFGPLARPPERIGATFTRCGQGSGSFACVVDGDTLRLGDRRVRIAGIDAPELLHPACAAERVKAEAAANRLAELLDAGPFDMVGHRFNRTDKYGRDLMSLTRGDQSIGQQMIDEGLAHRYMGMKRGWC